MQWIKRGLLFENDTTLWWSKGYAGIPTAEVNGDTIRIYYYSMDENMDGRIAYIDVLSDDPSQIVYRHTEPVLSIGEAGTFDDCGVCPSCIVNSGDKKRLYYLGVQRTEKVPYLYFAGVAELESDGNFKRLSRSPILDRTDSEPFVRSATTIVFENNSYRMWYVSAFDWIEVNGKAVPSYVIRHATSSDGLTWNTTDGICINIQKEDEFGFGRPWVIKEENKYKMWYSVRTKSKLYRIGYAESSDGYSWKRMDDQAGIDVSESGWDSDMICYPSIVDAKGKRYLFYNGNRHGQSGFGFAELKTT